MPRKIRSSSPSPPLAVESLSGGARLWLCAAALHDRPLPASWLDRLGVADEDVDALVAKKWIREENAEFSLHPAVGREQARRASPWSQRRRAHRLLAEACLDAPRRPEAAAQHFNAAGMTSAAADAYLVAGESHCRAHRHAAAERCFLAGLRLLPASSADEVAVRALQGLAMCATLAREAPRAIEELQTWMRSPPWSERLAVRVEANRVLAAWLARLLRHVESARARQRAARDLIALGRPVEAATAALAAANGLAYALQLSLAWEAVETAAQAAESAGKPDLQTEVAIARGMILGLLGETERGRRELERALDLALRHRMAEAAAEAYRLLGTMQEMASCYRSQQEAFARAISFCRRHDQTVSEGLCLGCLSYSFFRSGNWRRSEQTARRVLASSSVPEVSRAVAEGVLGLLHAHRGEARPAARLLRRSLAACRQMGVVAMDFFNLLGLAVVAENAGDRAAAGEHLSALAGIWRGTEDRHDGLPGLALAATVWAGQGRREEVANVAEALERMAGLTANPEAEGAAHLAAAEVCLLDDDAAAAVDLLRRSLTAYERRDLSVELIRARLRLGVALQRAGKAEEAAAVLAEAKHRARRLGARPLAAQAESALRESAVAETRRGEGAWETLSARQRDVARHLVSGLANKEIAARLGVSVRTAEMHVAGVLARLDCRSRAQAAARIAEALA